MAAEEVLATSSRPLKHSARSACACYLTAREYAAVGLQHNQQRIRIAHRVWPLVGHPTQAHQLDQRQLTHAVHHYRSEEHTSELQSLRRISYAVFCLKKKKHLIDIGMLKKALPDEHQKKLMEEKRAEYMVKNSEEMDSTGYPKGSQLCSKCQTKAVIMMDGCLTCLSCGDSKCG